VLHASIVIDRPVIARAGDLVQEEHDMAILVGTGDAGELTFYDVPEDVASQHKLQSQELTDADRERLFPGKAELTKEDWHGEIRIGAKAEAPEVEAYGAWGVPCVVWWTDPFGNIWYQNAICD
jgi:hypothetical protein